MTDLKNYPRLRWDFEVSETSPVVHGTWVTVDHIITRIVEGYTWAEILRNMPELTEEDIREALKYKV